MNTQKDLRRLLAGMKINRVVSVTADKASIQNRVLRLFLVQVYELKSLALLDTVSKPNLISTSLLKKNGVRAKSTKRGITVASGDDVNCKRVVKDFPVCFDNGTTTM